MVMENHHQIAILSKRNAWLLKKWKEFHSIRLFTSSISLWYTLNQIIISFRQKMSMESTTQQIDKSNSVNSWTKFNSIYSIYLLHSMVYHWKLAKSLNKFGLIIRSTWYDWYIMAFYSIHFQVHVILVRNFLISIHQRITINFDNLISNELNTNRLSLNLLFNLIMKLMHK